MYIIMNVNTLGGGGDIKNGGKDRKEIAYV
jgi:hypothetical protein